VLNRAEEDLVMLVELSLVDQRYEAVKEVLDQKERGEGGVTRATATGAGVFHFLQKQAQSRDGQLQVLPSMSI
jgi:hypothetical protein